MGANVRFIAFREAPDIAKLSAVAGLTGFRLFKHNARPEWYLEGPNPDGDAITFFESLDYTPKGDSFKRAQANAKAFSARLKREGLNVYGLDERALTEALTLSLESELTTLLIDSNDDGVDAGFICDAGDITFAKLPASQREMVVFENGAARAQAPNTDEFDEGEPVLDLHHFASEVANAFFGTAIRWRVTSDPYEFDAAEFTLVGAHGQRAPFRLPGDDLRDALSAIEAGAAIPAEKLRNCLALMDTHVAAAADPKLITATRAEVDYVDFHILACAVHANHRRHGDAAYAALSAYFEQLLQYLRRLKPKPDFRHDMDFANEGRRLLREWQALKMKLTA